MNLQEAFGYLIQKRAWYKNSGISAAQALRDKRLFLAGKKIPEERMRLYLKSADWICVQEESWKMIFRR